MEVKKSDKIKVIKHENLCITLKTFLYFTCRPVYPKKAVLSPPLFVRQARRGTIDT